MIASQAALSSLAFSPDGWTLVTGSRDGTVQQWMRFPAAADATTPRAQRQVHLIRVGHLRGSVDGQIGGMAIEGRHAYLTNGETLRVVDVSEGSQPQVVGSCELTGSIGPRSVSGHYACALGEHDVQIVDLSDPAAPRVAGSCELNARPWAVAVQGQFAYVTDVESVRVVDFSAPANPKEVGRCPVEEAQGITVAGQYAYVACDIEGLRIVDISNPTAPREVTTFEGPQGAADVAVEGNYAYIAGGEDAVTLWIADVSDSTSPKSMGRYGDWIVGNVAVHGDHAYIAGGELEVADVSDPATPKRAGRYRDAEQVAVRGSYVYVAGFEGFSILRAVWSEK
jgi:hypothetical protein